MSDGTMIRNRPRVREADSDELSDRRPRAFVARLRSAGRAVGAATVVAVVGAGMFALLGPGQTVRGEDPRMAAAAAAGAEGTPPGAETGGSDEAADAEGATAAVPPAPVVQGAKPGKVVRATRPTPAVTLPPAEDLTAAARRTALVSYLERAGVPVVTGAAQVVRAARDTCTALDGGVPAGAFVSDLARIAGYTAAQSTSFVTGATHFYCPRHAEGLAR